MLLETVILTSNLVALDSQLPVSFCSWSRRCNSAVEGAVNSNPTFTLSELTPVAFTINSTIEFVVSASTVKEAGAEKDPKASNGKTGSDGGTNGGTDGGTDGGCVWGAAGAGPIVNTTASVIAKQKAAEMATITLRFELSGCDEDFVSAFSPVEGGRSTSLTRSNRKTEASAIGLFDT